METFTVLQYCICGRISKVDLYYVGKNYRGHLLLYSMLANMKREHLLCCQSIPFHPGIIDNVYVDLCRKTMIMFRNTDICRIEKSPFPSWYY